jgi:hypothetical protein
MLLRKGTNREQEGVNEKNLKKNKKECKKQKLITHKQTIKCLDMGSITSKLGFVWQENQLKLQISCLTF